ncbi:hypothetical protein [Lysinibacillus sp. FW12]|uniref:hypothetical protein n=1 Tax=Lysinibacillus sp. FW12 TaxID=3096079 RepID=UPI003D75340F
MFKNWTNRDWIWLTALLLFLMVLLIANFYKKWDPQISIIANSTSIALAVIAIFLSLKQDSDSKSTSESMRQDLSTQMGNITMLLANRKVEIEDAATSVSQTVDTNTETRSESYTYDQLVEYGEKIKKDTIEEFKKELNEKMLENAMIMGKNTNVYTGSYITHKLEKDIYNILKNNPYIDVKDVIGLLDIKSNAFIEAKVRDIIKNYRTNI